MLHVLRVFQIQQNRLWTCLEGEDEGTEEEEEEEAEAHDGEHDVEEETEGKRRTRAPMARSSPEAQ